MAIDNRISAEVARKQAAQGARDKAQNLKVIAFAFAILAKIATRLAFEGIKNFLSFGNNQKSDAWELVGNILDNIPRGQSKGKNLLKSLGNKSRGATRGLPNKAKVARKARQAGKTGKLISKGGKVVRFAKTAQTAKNAATAVKTAKTAHTAYKAYKVAKLANLGRIAVSGGVALAGGPVGIGLLVGSVVAPIAIEHIWKNRESIYQGSKDFVERSQVALVDIKGLIAGKNANVGEIVPDAAGLKVEGSDKSILFEADSRGKVISNSFQPEQKLAFYQGNDQARTMLFDEQEVFPSPKASIDLSKSDMQPVIVSNQNQTNQADDISGVSLIVKTLDELAKNNPENYQIQNQVSALKQGLSTVLISNLNATQIEDLGYLKEDLRLSEGITGDFIPVKPQQPEDFQEKELVNTSESSKNASQDQSSVFSEFLQQRDGNSEKEGNYINELNESIDYER